jgi:flavin reductase (DIM6/NTAB) family NADH-FMN oxidoreductase RutF
MFMKKEVKAYPLIHPSPIVIVSTLIEEVVNFMTIGDVAVAGLNPPLVMISVNANHRSMEYLKKKMPFGINVMDKNYIKEVDYAGVFSSKQKDKSTLFQSEFIDGVPVVSDSLVSLILKEVDRIQIKQRVILVCEVEKTLVEERLIQGNNIDFSEAETIVYGLDNKYYELGKSIGKGYDVFKG